MASNRIHMVALVVDADRVDDARRALNLMNARNRDFFGALHLVDRFGGTAVIAGDVQRATGGVFAGVIPDRDMHAMADCVTTIKGWMDAEAAATRGGLTSAWLYFTTPDIETHAMGALAAAGKDWASGGSKAPAAQEAAE